MTEQGTDHVWLDATGLDHFSERFPNIAADLAWAGLDPARDLLPVAPAAHHQCGGVVTDLWGATSLPGLWAAGEVTCTGVHGANRLASNSLLEGMVFGPRAVEAIAAGADGPEPSGAMRAVLGFPTGPPPGDSLDIGGVPLELGAPVGVTPASGSAGELREQLQRAMSRGAGVRRSAEGLAHCAEVVASVAAAIAGATHDAAVAEVRNLAEVAAVLVAAARQRTESRGTHHRVDHPEPDEHQRHRIVCRGPLR
jgi:L-aspartate oxidase